MLRAHGLDLDTVWAGIDRLVAEGVLPGPQPSDAELLATLGIDLDAVMAHVKEGFGWEAYHYAAQRVRLRPIQAFPHAPGGGAPLICWRVSCLSTLVGSRGLSRDQLRTAVLEELGQDR